MRTFALGSGETSARFFKLLSENLVQIIVSRRIDLLPEGGTSELSCSFRRVSVELPIFDFGRRGDIDERTEIDDRAECKGTTVRGEESGIELRFVKDRAYVVMSGDIETRNADVRGSHLGQVVHENTSHRCLTLMPGHRWARYSAASRRWQCSGSASLHSKTTGTDRKSTRLNSSHRT